MCLGTGRMMHEGEREGGGVGGELVFWRQMLLLWCVVRAGNECRCCMSKY